MLLQTQGDNLTDLWFNLLVHLATSRSTRYYNPSVFCRRVYGYTPGMHMEDSVLEQDFFRYSGYNKDIKLSTLRASYFTDKVQKQFEILKEHIRDLQPRQARGLISFSEPAFDLTTRLKCLDSLYIQKETMTKYEAVVIFRSTELYPKLFMDFMFLRDILAQLNEESVRCSNFCAFITSGFINMFNAPLCAMLLRRYAITNWNEPFLESLKVWNQKFGDPDSLNSIKMQFIYRIVERTHRIMQEDGINIELLIEGK